MIANTLFCSNSQLLILHYVIIVVEKSSVVRHRDLYILQWNVSLRVGLLLSMTTSEHSHLTIDWSRTSFGVACASIPVVLNRRFVIGANWRAPIASDTPT